MRAFVAGASGVIGPVLVPMLVKEGHQVSAMTRTPEKIDAQRLCPPALDPLQDQRLPASLLERPLADRHDETRLLRQRDELVGGNQPPLRMLPPDQGLDPDDFLRIDLDLRLILQKQLVPIKCMP